MLPLNPWMLLGVAGVAIPILIHILTRQTGQRIEWAAMQFLADSLLIRNRRIRLEEALLMAARCLLVMLFAVALARPFVPPGSQVPWFLVLPLGFLATVAVAVGIVLWDLRRWRGWLLSGGFLLGALAAALIYFERTLNLSRFSQGGRQDIALILDVSTSMSLEVNGRSNLDRAVEEVRALLQRSPRGNAYSLILGGPAPTARVLAPTSDRDVILRELDEVEALPGSLAAYDSLSLAALALAQGSNPAKQIVMISDGQSVGWELDEPARWAFLEDAMANLPSTPRVILRELDLPRQVRNLTVREIALSRRVIGTDRPVTVDVTVENTGSEAVSPRQIALTVDGETKTSRTLGQLLPGTTETVSFSHRFPTPGARALEARLDVDDEIDVDDERARVVQVNERLDVLVVDGAFSGPMLERAGTFAALALSPELQAAALETREGNESRSLVHPTRVTAVEFSRMGSLESYDVVLLADVPRLPGDSTRLLEDFAEQGGGVLVAAGGRVDPAFYNAWKLRDGSRFLPARIGDAVVSRDEASGRLLSLDTFRHPALRLVADARQSDLDTAAVTRYWRLEANREKGSVVGGRFGNGDPFLVTRRVGLGQVMLLATSLDLRGGTLPLRQAFVPFLHEMVYFLADPKEDELNLDANWELRVHLSGEDAPFAGQGLNGEYYDSRDRRTLLHRRLDGSVEFNWKGGSPAPEVPADRFFVRWTGSIQPPVSGRFRFEAEVNDSLQVWVDGRNVLRHSGRGRPRSRQVWLDANRLHDFKAEFEERTGDAKAVLFWKGPDTPRQVVPPSAFRHADGEAREVLAEYAVEGPGERPCTAVIEASSRGVAARIQGDVAAGLYEIRIPEEERSRFGRLLVAGAGILPFTVRRDPAESRLEAFTGSERAVLEDHLGIAYPDTLDEVLQILSGASYGEELWRYLALAALAFVLLEVALTRWISRSRGTGEEGSVSLA